VCSALILSSKWPIISQVCRALILSEIWPIISQVCRALTLSEKWPIISQVCRAGSLMDFIISLAVVKWKCEIWHVKHLIVRELALCRSNHWVVKYLI
jgi:hypothetical protein